MIHFPPRKILVPMDGSESSFIAWEQAQHFTSAFGARAQALHVQSWKYEAMGLWSADAMATAESSLEMVSLLRARLGSESVVSFAGEPVDAIARWAETEKFDLVVMGSHGYTGLARLIFGSVSEAVARVSHVPVLVARRVTRKFDSILAPVRFMPYAREGLSAAEEVAEVLGARLHVLSVLTPDTLEAAGSLAGIENLQFSLMAHMPHSVRRVCRPTASVAFGNAVEQIVSEAEHHDLVVLVEHEQGYWNETFVGTTAERVMRTCTVPVLVIPMAPAAVP